jgi:hypothetical protein
MRMIEQEIKSYDSKKEILLVWLDAWRHENDKYGFIPLIRSIKITLENLENKGKWGRVVDAVNHTFESENISKMSKTIKEVMPLESEKNTLANWII